VKIDDDLPLDKAALVGCGVPTGWGSSVYAADVQPGETVIIAGVGGIGLNAVQGARYAGAKNLIAVDPLPNKRKKAVEFGATHTVATAAEAGDLARSMTNGNGADKTIVTASNVTEEIVTDAFDNTGKGGTVVITGANKISAINIQLPGTILSLFKKTVRGTIFGDCNPTTDIPMLLGLYKSGHVKLDELITRTYTLEQVNEGYDDLLNGKNIRSVLVHEH
jgi:S-(hydroxymethyl)glutathione dehydrogenase/alcohol dehydrogenase